MVVDPGRGDILVPQPLLYLSNIGLAVERIGRRCGPQRMRADLKPESRWVPSNDLVDRIRGDGFAPTAGPVADGSATGLRPQFGFE